LLSRYWRIFGTALSFALFGIGGGILTIVLLPILFFTSDSEGRRQAGKTLLKKVFQSFLWGMQFLGVMEFKVENLNLAKSGGRIILSNHPSLIDAIILGSFIEKPNGIIKSSLLNNPCMFGVAKLSGLLRNVEGTELIRKSIESVTNGDNLLIFPEGTRTKDLSRVEFKRGAAYIAIKGGINITPVFIYTSEPVLRKGYSWYKVPSKKPVFTISVMEEINVSSIVDLDGDLILGAEVLTRYLEELYINRLRKYGRT
jgi:1-acyl-sn-glycerol-3-phosphate acyltransferase